MILPFVAIAALVTATLYSAFVGFRQGNDFNGKWIFPHAAGRSARICVAVFTLAWLVGIALWLGMGGRHSPRRSSRFLIPEGYTGWIKVEFEVPGAPPLPMEGGQYLFKIPPGGKLQTSTAEQYGWANDRHYYYSAQGLRALPNSGDGRLIWGKINGEASGPLGKRKYEEFFVGTEEQFKH